jgi:sigma-B regulation protein RsbU (phosphoserine phosphatase)
MRFRRAGKCVFEGLEYKTRRTALQPGEGVLVYTDGVTEACNKGGEFYGEARLEAYLGAHASQPVEQLVRGVHAEIERFEAGARRADDITVLALRRSG